MREDSLRDHRGAAIGLYHCLDCQRLTGSAFSLGIVLPEKGFRLTGIEPRRLQRTADSGRVNTRLVCPECGSWVCGMPRDGVVRVRGGTLDDTSWLRPPIGTYGPAGSSLGACSPRAMKSSKDSLPDRTGTVRWPGVPGKSGGAFYAIIVFLIGFYPRHHTRPAARAALG